MCNVRILFINIVRYSMRTKVFARHKSQVHNMCLLLTKCFVGFQGGD